MLRYVLTFSMLIIFLSGCPYLNDKLDNIQKLRQEGKVTSKEDASGNTSSHKNSLNRESKSQVMYSKEFLKYLYDARINLATSNRSEALLSLTSAGKEAPSVANLKRDKHILIEVSFSKKGFVKTSVYLDLEKDQSKQILDIISNFKIKNQKITSINLVETKGQLVSGKTIELLNSAIRRLKEVNQQDPDYDLTIADRAIWDIYIGWQLSDYKSDIEFTTKYYLVAAENLLNQMEYDAAEEAIKKAKERYKDSYVITDFKSSNTQFVSYYEHKINELQNRLKKEEGTVVDGIINKLL